MAVACAAVATAVVAFAAVAKAQTGVGPITAYDVRHCIVHRVHAGEQLPEGQTDPDQRHGCLNGGTCGQHNPPEEYYSCACSAGWEGPDCSRAVCHGHGRVFDGTCRGVPSTDPGTPSVSSAGTGCWRCANGGNCTAPGTCTCAPGYGGRRCNPVNDDDAAAQGGDDDGGSAPPPMTTVARSMCSVVGRNHENRSCVQGTCVIGGPNPDAWGVHHGATEPHCMCVTSESVLHYIHPEAPDATTGWRGSVCETPVCVQGTWHDRCSVTQDNAVWPDNPTDFERGCYTCGDSAGGVHGLCTEPDFCTCFEGWTGFDCTTRMTTGDDDAGRDDTPATCSPGYTNPPGCTTPVCEFVNANSGNATTSCLHGGMCTAPNTCTCPKIQGSVGPDGEKLDAYAAGDCGVPVCNQYGTHVHHSQCRRAPASTAGHSTADQTYGCWKCPNGGWCTGPEHCECADGWTGVDCRTPTAPNQQSDGSCVDGWQGPLCADPVCGQECANGGTCAAPGAACDCVGGWHGPSCEEPAVSASSGDGVAGQDLQPVPRDSGDAPAASGPWTGAAVFFVASVGAAFFAIVAFGAFVAWRASGAGDMRRTRARGAAPGRSDDGTFGRL